MGSTAPAMTEPAAAIYSADRESCRAHLARLAASAGMELGHRRVAHAASPLSGNHRRARPLAVAGERAGPGASRVARVGSAASRASQSSGDADDVSLLGVVLARAGAAPAICVAGSPAKRSARGCAAWARTTFPRVLRVMREIGSALSYLHDVGAAHGCMSPDTVWTTPMGRLWIIGWQWAVPADRHPDGARARLPLHADPAGVGDDGEWTPTPLSDQWQLAAICFAALTGETPPPDEVPPLQLMRPDVSAGRAQRDRSRAAAGSRAPLSVASTAMLRAIDRVIGSRTMVMLARRRAGHAAHERVGGGASALGARRRLRSARGTRRRLVRIGVARARSHARPRGRAQAAASARRARRAHRRTLSSRGQARGAARASGDRPDLRLGQPRRRRVVHDGARRGRIGRRSRRALRTAHARPRSRRRSTSF